MYIERMNNCTMTTCNATEQEITFSAVAELCAIISVPVTIGPEATASIATSNPLFSTVGIPTQSSLPAVSTPILSSTPASSEILGSTTGSIATQESPTSPTESSSPTSLAPPTSATAPPAQSSSNDLSRLCSPSRLSLVLGVGTASILNMVWA
ncbi:hypothetical protein G647_04827 [Cladophialophora carrionii CBS 160.54]|uniref:Uncharacterized protein n=1 Tax=Cladophialophora carrionii CBS 160.54 TaxID=1279043 RepID=V9D8P8_9EURO|nr:uncharacterized protein G647_04827 [Cladophialophora carrionii CBS 160.54]ETI23031.1 hypothetical protein G647_04827 [Cladophialophora carrionii CBS 160.54]